MGKRLKIKELLLPTEVKAELRRIFKAYPMEVDRALKFTINSDRAKLLRAAALQRGAKGYTGEPRKPTKTNAL